MYEHFLYQDVVIFTILVNLVLQINNINDVNFESTYIGTVHTLDLSGCINLSDVSFLGNVKTLDLIGCFKITDVITIPSY